MDKFTGMKIFVRIIQLGSFTAVAAELGISQSSVSKKISALENSLGAALLIRSNRLVRLTEIGTNYYEYCQSILNLLEEAESQTKDYVSKPKGNLKINLPVTFGRIHVIPHIAGFIKEYPDINIELSFLDRRIDLKGDGFDLAIRIGTLPDSSLIARPLGYSPRIVVASPFYIEKYGKPHSLDDLKQHNCLIYTNLSSINIWHFTSNNQKFSVQIKGTLQSNCSDAILECTRSGVGIAVLPYWFIQHHLDDETLVPLLEDMIPVEFPINAIYPNKNYIPNKIKCFIDYMKHQYDRTPVIKT